MAKQGLGWMRRCLSWLALLALGAELLAPATAAVAPGQGVAVVKAARSCEELLLVDVSDIGGAGSRIARTTLSGRNGKQVCEVEGTLAPSIGFRVALPLDSWTQRYVQVGCGGLCGRISTQVGAADGCEQVKNQGLAVASTDMGHQGQSSDFGDDPQKREDFAYRGVHLTAVAAKRLIREFYGQAPSYSYFTGCSDGGREALMEAQRYPDDFDGVIAGAAALNFLTQNAVYHAWQARSNTGEDGKPVLIASRLPLLHAEVLKQCDALDGQADGVINDPRRCQPDLSKIQCKASEDVAGCLTPAEVAAARKLYDGPRDPATGKRLTVGGPLPGSELGWAGVFVPNSKSASIFSSMVSLQVLQNLAYPVNPPAGYTIDKVDFSAAGFDQLRPMHALYDATNPDLSKFAARGGKLILWHGLGDPHISPMNSIAYHHAVEQTMGEQKTAAFERLYLFPGMHHCGGGEGLSGIDLLTPMMAWVEQGKAPQEVIASTKAEGPGSFGAPTARPGGAPGAAGRAADGPPPGMVAPPQQAAAQPQKSRPVYPYPYLSVYKGSGDPAKADSYTRGTEPARYTVPAWLGADFFRAQP